MKTNDVAVVSAAAKLNRQLASCPKTTGKSNIRLKERGDSHMKAVALMDVSSTDNFSPVSGSDAVVRAVR